MKLNLLAAVVVGAALTEVGATPIRVVVVSELSTIQNIRYGHTAADSPVAKIALPKPPATFVTAQPVRRPCSGRVKAKAIEISNFFRHALGLPSIETGQPQPGDRIHGGMVHILPFVGTPNTFPQASPHHMNENQGKKPHFHHHHAHFHRQGDTFWKRVHNSLMALSPWEGRAVAFVFGCGIGVLLRMIWVLTVVTYRSIRGDHDDEYTQVAVIEEYIDAEDMVVSPPTYTLADEKEQFKVKDAAEN